MISYVSVERGVISPIDHCPTNAIWWHDSNIHVFSIFKGELLKCSKPLKYLYFRRFEKSQFLNCVTFSPFDPCLSLFSHLHTFNFRDTLVHGQARGIHQLLRFPQPCAA